MTSARMTAWRPRLRPDVELVRDGVRLVALRDPTLDRRLPCGPVSAALVERLDGTRTVAELAPDEGALRALLLLNLLEGCGDAIVERVRRTVEEPVPAPSTLDDARFGCAGSGRCCQVYNPGPLSDEDLARLESIGDALRAKYPGPWIVERDSGRYLRRAEGRCVFLRDDARCGLHAEHGPEKKPDVCRLFPFDAVRTIDGLRVWDIGQCSAYAVTSRQGELASAQTRWIAPLLPARPRLFHPMVFVDRETPCDYGHVRPLEAALLEAASAPEDTASERVLRVASLVRAFSSSVATCELAPDGPERAIRAALEATPEPIERDTSGGESLRACAEALAAASHAKGESEAPLAPALREVLSVVAELGRVDPTLGVELDRRLASELLRTSFRNRIFGARFALEGRLLGGVLRFALLALLTTTGARLRAAALSRAAATVEDLSAGHWIAALALARPGLMRALVPFEDRAFAIAAEVAALV